MSENTFSGYLVVILNEFVFWLFMYDQINLHIQRQKGGAIIRVGAIIATNTVFLLKA